MAQRERGLNDESAARETRSATPVLAETQRAREQQEQRDHKADDSNNDVEAAAKIAQSHRAADDAQEADEGAQLQRGRERESEWRVTEKRRELTYQAGDLREALDAAQILAIAVMVNRHARQRQ